MIKMVAVERSALTSKYTLLLEYAGACLRRACLRREVASNTHEDEALHQMPERFDVAFSSDCWRLYVQEFEQAIPLLNR